MFGRVCVGVCVTVCVFYVHIQARRVWGQEFTSSDVSLCIALQGVVWFWMEWWSPRRSDVILDGVE